MRKQPDLQWVTLIIILFTATCGPKSSVQEDKQVVGLRAVVGGSDKGLGGTANSIGNTQQNENGAPVLREIFDSKLQTKELFMPAPTLLEPKALEQVYRPIFGPQPRVKAGAIAFFVANPGAFFSPSEREMLGEMHVSGPEKISFVPQNTLLRKKQGLPATYLAALRAVASDGCKNLVNADLLAPLGTGVIVQARVDASDVNQLLGRFIRKPILENHFNGVDGYTAATSEALQAAEAVLDAAKKAILVRDAWVELCVALATDPRVFIR